MPTRLCLALATIVLMSVPASASSRRNLPPSSGSQNPPPSAPQITGQQAGVPQAPFFTVDMTFEQAIDLLRRSTSRPLNLVVLWREIEDNAQIYRDTPINIEVNRGLRVRQYLELLLAGVSAGSLDELGYVVRKGAVIVATKDSLPSRRVTRVYDISDLVAPPAQYGFPGMGLGGMGYGGIGMGGMGYGGMGMMGGQGGYGRGGFGTGYGGGFGGGYGGAGYLSPGSYGYGRGQGLSGFLGGLYGGAPSSSGRYYRR